jgi:hypothetical protein
MEYVRSGEAFRDMNWERLATQAPTQKWDTLLSDSYPALRTKYSNSNYTFFAGLYRAMRYGGGDPVEILSNEIRVHPTHPLIDDAKMLQAMVTIREKARPDRQDKELLPDVDVDSIILPNPLRKYLQHYKWETIARAKNITSKE